MARIAGINIPDNKHAEICPDGYLWHWSYTRKTDLRGSRCEPGQKVGSWRKLMSSLCVLKWPGLPSKVICAVKSL